mmetsp:Transcript_20525/g.68913  ORF Transcript_20525/g.68913 Transcript_20525/m.68913 type:complete len:209 (-) Transcript_20525:131-757(-)
MAMRPRTVLQTGDGSHTSALWQKLAPTCDVLLAPGTLRGRNDVEADLLKAVGGKEASHQPWRERIRRPSANGPISWIRFSVGPDGEDVGHQLAPGSHERGHPLGPVGTRGRINRAQEGAVKHQVVRGQVHVEEVPLQDGCLHVARREVLLRRVRCGFGYLDAGGGEACHDQARDRVPAATPRDEGLPSRQRRLEVLVVEQRLEGWLGA